MFKNRESLKEILLQPQTRPQSPINKFFFDSRTKMKSSHDRNQLKAVTEQAISFDCQSKKCVFIKFQLNHIIKENAELKEAKKKYEDLYQKERKKISRRLKEFQEIHQQLQNKEENHQIQIQDLQKQISLFEEQKKESEYVQLQMESEKLIFEETKQAFTKWEKEVLDKKWVLEQTVKELQNKQNELVNSCNSLSNKEIECLKRISQLQEMIQNSQQHFINIQELERKMSEKCKSLDSLQTQLAWKQDEQSYLDQKLNLRTMCASLNEELFQKKIEQECEQLRRQRQCTPPQRYNQHSSNKLSLFFKNKYEQNGCSTIFSGDVSPKDSSFKIFKKDSGKNSIYSDKIF